MDDRKRAEEALLSISPDIPYEDWMKVGMAAQASGIDFDTFDRWSSGGRSYTKGTTVSLWKSYREDKGIGIGTLFHIAKAHGYQPHSQKAVQPLPDVDLSNILARFKQSIPAPRFDPQAIWDRSEPASIEHPYIQRKHGIADGLRVIPSGDPLPLMGVSMEGSLVVPVHRPDGSISTLQLITSGASEDQLKAKGKPTKLNLPDCSMDGWFMVGSYAPGGRIFVCEGIGQAWACWISTGQAAVVAFGWGRVRTVVQQLIELHPDQKVVLVPDKGKELQAAELAKELSCHFVSMPEDWPNNSDVNDLFVRDGHDVLDALLDQAIPPRIDTECTHPLAQYIDINCQPKAPRWVIPGFIGHGVVIIAGAHGVGKTTALLPLSMVAAGLHAKDDPLKPQHWRHVIYIVEDIEQAERILAGMVGDQALGLHPKVVGERLHLVEALRLPPGYVATVGATYKQQFTRIVDGVEILPLVVMDTKAAVLAMENENDNAEGSAAMAALKQGFEGLPTWIIGHVAKQDLGRSDAATLTLRGGSSFEADANQVLYLVKERDGTRYLVRGKTRFEAKWSELKIDSYSAQTEVLDEFGLVEQVVLRWGIPRPTETSRHEQVVQATDDIHHARTEALRREILQEVDRAQKDGMPLNRQGVKFKVRRNRNEVHTLIECLISESWLFEVDIPSEIRTNPKRQFFLIAFTTEERDAFLEDGVLPSDKIVIPASWRKPATLADLKVRPPPSRKRGRQTNPPTVRIEPSVSP